MSFLSILLALLVEQVRPLLSGNAVHAAIRGWLRWVVRKLDAGGASQAWVVWGVSVGVPTTLAILAHALLQHGGWLLALAFNVVVLYATLGFRQFSHHFTEIRAALQSGDEVQARQLLAEWLQIEAAELPSREIIRQVIVHSVIAAHRHVFGVLSWFVLAAALGLGPAGAVFYRLAEFVTRYWPYISRRQAPTVSEGVCAAAATAWHWIDWLPARITVLGFAVVGSFEEVMDSWRRRVQQESSQELVANDDLIVGATAAAIRVRLGQTGTARSDAEILVDESHDEPQLAHLYSVVGLVWRSVVMWMLLLALLTLAHLIG